MWLKGGVSEVLPHSYEHRLRFKSLQLPDVVNCVARDALTAMSSLYVLHAIAKMKNVY